MHENFFFPPRMQKKLLLENFFKKIEDVSRDL